MRNAVIILLFTCVACATPAAPPPGATANTAAVPRLLLPTVLPGVPARTFIDLGPVLISAAQPGADANAVLLAEADRLGADAFVLEARGIDEVYGLGASGDQSTAQRTLAVILASLLTGGIPLQSADNSPDRRATGFYRAIRYLDDDGQPVDVSRADVSRKSRDRLAAAPSLREQYRLVVTMFFAGELATTEYEHLRRRLAGS